MQQPRPDEPAVSSTDAEIQENPRAPPSEPSLADGTSYASYVQTMRTLFSPPGICNPDGSLRQDYFKPKRVVLMHEKKFGEAEREALYVGLARYGVGKWREMTTKIEQLAGWDETQLRVRAAKLLGSQSLARYGGWRGDRAAVEAEHAKNRCIGEATGCWKAGILVEDDAGSVRRYLADSSDGQDKL